MNDKTYIEQLEADMLHKLDDIDKLRATNLRLRETIRQQARSLQRKHNALRRLREPMRLAISADKAATRTVLLEMLREFAQREGPGEQEMQDIVGSAMGKLYGREHLRYCGPGEGLGPLTGILGGLPPGSVKAAFDTLFPGPAMQDGPESVLPEPPDPTSPAFTDYLMGIADASGTVARQQEQQA